jgi:1-deoxy-D-xylulose-5-phosphate reductoisomerase
LEVAAALPKDIRVAGLAANSNVELFTAQVRQWRPEVAVLFNPEAYRHVKSQIDLGGTKLLCGLEGLCEAATWPNVDVVLGAMLGAAGLQPTLAAIGAGRDVAIANKETLVAAGEIVMAEARKHGVTLWPVDSEHSALAQCLAGEKPESVRTLTITASGGPFFEWSREEIAAAPAAKALKHPTWTMGRKITIDSATLMNKGLEMIEAHWLFEVPMEQIDVVVHRQSIVHSFVTFRDGSVKAQLGVPDMKLPIQLGLLRGRRAPGDIPELSLWEMGPLTFAKPDTGRFPALELAREAMRLGGTAPAAMNAANEVAVEAFLQGKTNFYGITDVISRVLERHENTASPTLNEILSADADARRQVGEILKAGG